MLLVLLALIHKIANNIKRYTFWYVKQYSTKALFFSRNMYIYKRTLKSNFLRNQVFCEKKRREKLDSTLFHATLHTVGMPSQRLFLPLQLPENHSRASLLEEFSNSISSKTKSPNDEKTPVIVRPLWLILSHAEFFSPPPAVSCVVPRFLKTRRTMAMLFKKKKSNDKKKKKKRETKRGGGGKNALDNFRKSWRPQPRSLLARFFESLVPKPSDFVHELQRGHAARV